jgi:alpha-tubulin suppressor-like RCC1 family protein
MKRTFATVFAVVLLFLVAPSCASNNVQPGSDGGGSDVVVGPCGPGSAVMCGTTCVDVQSNAQNCGLCGKACGPDLVCSHGTCSTVCGGGTSRCGNDCVDLTADVSNCGGCNKPCDQGQVCSKGTCAATCQTGLTSCGGDCVDLTTNDSNCGTCGYPCPSGQVCGGSGQCQATCQSGWTSCPAGDAGTTCADTQHDPTHCGTCNNTCPPGYFCSPKNGVGTCGLQCFGGTSQCGTACVDENIDPNNCGGCSATCGGTCSGGHCCSKGDLYCGGCDTVANCIKKTGGRIASGYGHTCAITLGGALKCWGYGYDGELGDGTTTTTSTSPVDVSGLSSGVTNVGAGQYHTCAVANGTASCWGDDTYGQTGIGTDFTTYNTPQTVTGLSSVLKIDGGGDQTCALLTNQSVYCWGGNFNGEVGDGTGTEQDSPVATGVTSALDINAGLGSHTCALLSTGGASCWGEGDLGECGDGNLTPSNLSPVTVSSLSGGFAISLGYAHSCAVVSGGALKCWGDETYSELGDNGTTNSAVPVTASQTGVAAVAGGFYHTCALTNAGAVTCWGYNFYGQLGNGTNTDSTSPVTAISSGAAAISAGFYHTCAFMTDGTVQCWGYNGDGELGNGTNTDSNIPVKVTGF